MVTTETKAGAPQAGTEPAAKLRISNLIVELTRRCNMTCEHCLRGPAQRMDLDRKTIRAFLSRIQDIDEITFTGGEPSLKPDLMMEFLNECKKRNIYVRRVWLATNGKRVTDAFLDACRAWHAYCLEGDYGAGSKTMSVSLRDSFMKTMCIGYHNEERMVGSGCFVTLSVDAFHDDIPNRNLYRLATLPNLTMDKYHTADDTMEWILDGGRAHENGLSLHGPGSYRRPSENPLRPQSAPDIFDHGSGEYDIEQLYLSSDGSILTECDYAYRYMALHAWAKVDPDDRNKASGWLEDLLAKAEISD